MDMYEWNKIFGAFFGTLLLILVLGWMTEFIYHAEPANELAYVVEGVVEEGEETAVAEAEPETDLALLLQNASVEGGQEVSKACVACHSFEQGGANKVGPNLWNVVGGPKARLNNFNYSSALASAEGDWTFEALDAFLANPRGYLPGTSMSYAGIRRDTDRADMLVYLNSLGSNVPLPEPAAPAEAEAGESPEAAGEGVEDEGELPVIPAEGEDPVVAPEEAVEVPVEEALPQNQGDVGEAAGTLPEEGDGVPGPAE